jgi:hypothetical protein
VADALTEPHVRFEGEDALFVAAPLFDRPGPGEGRLIVVVRRRFGAVVVGLSDDRVARPTAREVFLNLASV